MRHRTREPGWTGSSLLLVLQARVFGPATERAAAGSGTHAARRSRPVPGPAAIREATSQDPAGALTFPQDRFSGYRRYLPDQLPDARLIARLRHLDLPLSVVAAVPAAAPPDRAAVLRNHWASVTARFAAQRRLAGWTCPPS